jgi:hypothetical protein
MRKIKKLPKMSVLFLYKSVFISFFIERKVRNGDETEGSGGVQPEIGISERNFTEKYFLSSQNSKVCSEFNMLLKKTFLLTTMNAVSDY